ncbi:MAG: hypothetical protein WBQ34_09475 [Candidatus Acidiferrales bacterium]
MKQNNDGTADVTFADADLLDQPTATQAQTQTQTSKAAPDDDSSVDLLADADELKAKPGLANIAPKEQNRAVRFFLVKGTPAFSKPTHFIAGAGPNSRGMTYVCPGDDCCECQKGGDHGSRRKIVAIAVKYLDTQADGKFPAGITVPQLSVGFLNLSPTAYTELSTCPSEGETLYDCDFRMLKKSNGIGYVFGRMSSPPAYKKAKLEAAVTELIQPYLDGTVLKNRLGKRVTAAELRLAVSGGETSEETKAMSDKMLNALNSLD